MKHTHIMAMLVTMLIVIDRKLECLHTSDLCSKQKTECKPTSNKMTCQESLCASSRFKYECGLNQCSISKETCEEFIRLKFLLSVFSRDLRYFNDQNVHKLRTFLAQIQQCPKLASEWKAKIVCSKSKSCFSTKRIPIRAGHIFFLSNTRGSVSVRKSLTSIVASHTVPVTKTAVRLFSSQ